MASYQWRPFLENYSRELLRDRDLRPQMPREVIKAGWMGFKGATAGELKKLETRLKVQLPESYRQFLATSNGWRQSGGFIYEMLPAARVEWFCRENQDWIDAYVEPAEGEPLVPLKQHRDYSDKQDPCKYRVRHLQTALLISGVGDSAVYLLNPKIKTKDGEWEAWLFANWKPGASRYPSFWEMMQDECRSFVMLREASEARYFPEDGLDTLLPKMPHLVKSLQEQIGRYQAAKEARAARGEPQFENHSDMTVAALQEAKDAVEKIIHQKLPPAKLLQRLEKLQKDFKRRWKSKVRENALGSAGSAEGNRQAAGALGWFLNQPFENS